jgi:outer membrane protein TolC
MNVFSVCACMFFAATSAPEPTIKMTVEEAVAKALHEHPSIIAARYEERALYADQHSQFAQMLPRVTLIDSVSWYHLQIQDISKQLTFLPPDVPVAFPTRSFLNSFTLVGEQPLLGLIRGSFQQQAQILRAQAATEDYAATRSQIRLLVQTQYLKYFENQSLIKATQSAIESLEEQRTQAEKRFELGEFTQLDVLRIQTALANQERQMILYQAETEASETSLRILLGLENTQPVKWLSPDHLYAPYTPPDKAFILDKTLQYHPQLKSIDKQAKAALKLSYSQQWALLPELQFQAQINRYTLSEQENLDMASASFLLSWPIWDFGAKWLQYRSAQLRAKKTHAQKTALEMQLTEQVNRYYAQYQSAAAAIHSAQVAMDSAKESFRVAQAMLASATATTLDVLSARQAWAEAETNVVRARYNAALAKITLIESMGRDSLITDRSPDDSR